MRHFFMAVCSTVLSAVNVSANAQTISLSQLKNLNGYWKGTLTYLDYTTGKPFTMPAELAIYSTKNGLIIQTTYPEEPQANNNDTILIGEKDSMFMGSKISKLNFDSTGNFEIVTVVQGKDGNDNKDALLKKTYTVQNGIYKVQKEVQFVGSDAWIVRHTYKFKRQVNNDPASFSGTWLIDLRPNLAAAPYLKNFEINIQGHQASGIFYDTKFTGGLINTEWNRISFAFTTADNSGEYVHTGYFTDGKITGFSYSKARGFVIPWFSVKKVN